MEKHGYYCWAIAPDEGGTCLACVRTKNAGAAGGDRWVLKLYYENWRITAVHVTAEPDAAP
jgi:hypothetical protein